MSEQQQRTQTLEQLLRKSLNIDESGVRPLDSLPMDIAAGVKEIFPENDERVGLVNEGIELVQSLIETASKRQIDHSEVPLSGVRFLSNEISDTISGINDPVVMLEGVRKLIVGKLKVLSADLESFDNKQSYYELRIRLLGFDWALNYIGIGVDSRGVIQPGVDIDAERIIGKVRTLKNQDAAVGTIDANSEIVDIKAD